MKMRNEIVIDAPAERIFALAAATAQWPQILPHYRFVRVLSDDGTRRALQMGAVRAFGPLGINVSWRAEQVNDAALPQIYFHHTGGWTRGMDVFWRFTPSGNGTHVAIDHEFHSPLAPFIGKVFVDPIATRTLNRIKELAES